MSLKARSIIHAWIHKFCAKAIVLIYNGSLFIIVGISASLGSAPLAHAQNSKGTEQQIKHLVGPDAQALYDLAADILPTIVNDTGGDAIKIQIGLEQIVKNPESPKSRSANEQLARIKDLAQRTEARQPASDTAH